MEVCKPQCVGFDQRLVVGKRGGVGAVGLGNDRTVSGLVKWDDLLKKGGDRYTCRVRSAKVC